MTNSLSKTSKEDNQIESTKPKVKRPRSRLTESTGPLSCKSMDGYHLRWVALNDPRQPRNMEWAKANEYTVVTPEEQNITESLTYNKDLGSDIRVTGNDGVTSILMKQPIDYYNEVIQEFVEDNDNQLNTAERQQQGQEAIGTFGKTVLVNNFNVKGNK